jgi:ATP-binding cassette subfamily F protein 3
MVRDHSSHIESTIRNAKATAKKSGDENKSRLASQRQKKLDERCVAPG